MQIKSINWGEEPFFFGARNNPNLGSFFKVNTMNLVIGKNGSGKTLLLQRLATSLGNPRDHLSEIAFDPASHAKNPSGAARSKFGVIYFTPLPYRRDMERSPLFRDASPSYKEDIKSFEYEIFLRTARDLSVNTELRGVVRFSSLEIETALIEMIMSSVMTFSNPNLDGDAANLRDNLKIVRIEMPRNSEIMRDDILRYGPQSFSQFDRSDLLMSRHILTNIKTDVRRDFFLKVYLEMTRSLKSEFKAILALSSLQRTAKNREELRYLLTGFLNSLGIVDSQLALPNDDGRYLNFLNNFEEARSRLGSLPALDIADHTITFKLLSYEHLQAFESLPQVQFEWSDLSSGLRALISQFCSLRRSIQSLVKKGANTLVILIDEGDAYLHLEWQRQYVHLLDQFLSSTKADLRIESLQVVLATHSPVIASDFPRDMIVSLDTGPGLPEKTLAAPIEQIIFSSFQANSIGEVAVQKINELHKALQSEALNATNNAILNEIGDIGLERALRRISPGGDHDN